MPSLVMSIVTSFQSLILIFIWLLLTEKPFIHTAQSDVDCLKSIKDSLQDPRNYLSSWNFDNTTEGFICKFTGVECWLENENKVSKILLSGMGLKGEFPLGISKCMSMTGFDLSSNDINGTIPANISKLLYYVTTLDLSSNQLSGEIPVAITNLSFLNTLRLDNNRLTGQIPPEIGLLSRIKTFNVAKNQLRGPIPRFMNASFSAESFANNAGLCGDPLPRCVRPAKKTNTLVIFGGAVGGITVGALIFGVYFFLTTMARKRKK